MKVLSKIYNGIIFTFLYAPIVVLIIYSFNDSKNRVKWEGFTLDWYKELFNNDLIMEALWLTLQIAVLAAVISTIKGSIMLGLKLYFSRRIIFPDFPHI